MEENLKRSVELVLMDEGGFAERAAEPGGAVNKGISLLVFQEWRKKQNPHSFLAGIDDLRAMSTIEAMAIYGEKYATPMRFNSHPIGLDYLLLDTAVMEGVRGAIMLLQQAIGIPTSGTWDTATLEALSLQPDARSTMLKLTCERLNKKLHGAHVADYGAGQGNRIMRSKDRALEMMR